MALADHFVCKSGPGQVGLILNCFSENVQARNTLGFPNKLKEKPC